MHAWFITISITIVFLFVLYLLILQWHVGGYGKYFGVILPPVIYFLAWVFRPVDYRITEDELIVYRLLRSVHIPLKIL
jgi:hypothetical protein